MKEFFVSVLKMIVVILIVFTIPFIFPVLLKFFLYYKVFESVDEFEKIINIFNNMYIFAYIGLGIGILLWFFKKWNIIRDVFKNFNFSITFGDKKIMAEHVKAEIEDINQQKEVIKKITKETSSDSENAINETKALLGIDKGKNAKNKCKECNKNELEEENDKLREDKFKSRIIQGYKKRNKKNIKFSKKEINKIARNKYDTIYDGLKFLNIIEPSEDDKIVKLTEKGRNFVEKYIEKKEVV